MANPVPHDPEAEAHVVGCCLIRPNVVEQLVGILHPEDFLRMPLRLLFAAIVEMHETGRQIDSYTVARHLGAAVDHDAMRDAMAGVPSTSNVLRYAAAIVDARGRRELISLCAETIADAQAGAVDAAAIVDQTHAALGRVAVPSAGLPAGLELVDDLLDRPPERRTPWVIPGLLRRDWRVTFVAVEGAGKLLGLDTEIPTPTGWSKIGDLSAGDEVLDRWGKPCRIVSTHDEATPEMRRVYFDDGSSLVACVDHQWVTSDYEQRLAKNRGDDSDPRRWPMSIRTTAEIERTLTARGGHTLNHTIPLAAPLDLPDVDLPVDPYTLGVYLAEGGRHDGIITLNRHDADEMRSHMADPGHSVPSQEQPNCIGVRVLGLKPKLRSLGALDPKCIPPVYMRASVEQRRALLAGIMDGDGHMPDGSGHGRGRGSQAAEIDLMAPLLAGDLVELALTLGCKVTVRHRRATLNGRDVGERQRIRIAADFNPFRLSRKAQRWFPPRTARTRHRFITAVEPTLSIPGRCLMVDSPDHTYLAGRQLIATHNTLLLQQIGMCAAQGLHPFAPEEPGSDYEPARVLFVDLENSEDRIASGAEMVHRPTVVASGQAYDRSRTWVWQRPHGINLRGRTDLAELESVLSHVRPTLVCFGPLYKATTRERGEGWDEAALAAQHTLDRLRYRHGFALVMEDHAPQGSGGVRDLRPFGSSLWLRWPELGLKLIPDDDDRDRFIVGRWRHDRLKNSWPVALERSNPWPWKGIWRGGFEPHRDETHTEEPMF